MIMHLCHLNNVHITIPIYIFYLTSTLNTACLHSSPYKAQLKSQKLVLAKTCHNSYAIKYNRNYYCTDFG